MLLGVDEVYSYPNVEEIMQFEKKIISTKKEIYINLLFYSLL